MKSWDVAVVALCGLTVWACGSDSLTGSEPSCRRFASDLTRAGEAGRLVERKRSRDTVEYRSWDDLGRPTSGILHTGDESEPVTVIYPGPREMGTSNGEPVVWDRHGDIVREVLSDGFVVEYVTRTTREVCL